MQYLAEYPSEQLHPDLEATQLGFGVGVLSQHALADDITMRNGDGWSPPGLSGLYSCRGHLAVDLNGIGAVVLALDTIVSRF